MSRPRQERSQNDTAVTASLPRDQELIYPPIQEFWDKTAKGTS